MRLPVRLPTLIAAPLLAIALLGASPPPPVDRLGPAGDYPVTVGDPFTVDGQTYTPLDTMNYDAVGYAAETEGAGVAGGHRTLPFPSYVEVTALDSGRTALVRIDRRGPMAGDGLIELTPMARAQLGLAPGQRAAVRVRRVNPPEPERALLRTGQQVPARMDTPPGLLAALKRKLGIAPPAPALVDLPPSVPVVAAVVTKPAAAKPQPAAQPRPLARHTPLAHPTSSATATVSRHVQVGAFSTRARAEAAARQVGGTVTPSGNLWRVRIGASSTAQAQAALAKARRAGYADARVLTEK
ncbi:MULTISPECIES: SPOR domain-containing protein [Novosphingobium]|uniref:SPOR domain-containing protein n=1 Tax=Novosphingobium TaxID=165696 RepID=UPI001CD75425|nr:SPOR domain-containing protein [Novosphingobium percolationis]